MSQSAALRVVASDRDRRFVAGTIERRAAAAPTDDSNEPTPALIVGYGALFNSEAVIGYAPWGFREILDPHCFDAAIARDDVRSFFNHDPNLILGRTTAGTLKVSADEKGLRYEIKPPDTSYAEGLAESIARGDVTGSSFMFRATKEEWTEPLEGSKELPLRKILEVELFEVGPVTFPAYEETSVSMNARSKSESIARPPAPATPTATDDPALAAARARAFELDLALETRADSSTGPAAALDPFRCSKCSKQLFKRSAGLRLATGEQIEIKCAGCGELNYLCGTAA